MTDFIKEVLEDPHTFGGFTIESYRESSFKKGVFYGRAKDKIGLTIIQWTTDKITVNYFGEELKDNQGVGILKDGGTRTAFNGYCFNKKDFKRVLKLTW